ncbi:MAG: hypothetical protein ABIS29_13880 [Vicinamibacterales bacterium]
MLKHPKVLLSVSVVSATLLVVPVSRLTAADSRAVFEGVWRTVEVVVPGPTRQTFRSASALAIFHGKHYSRVEVHVEGARPVLKNPATASADELRAVWGPFVAEAGTFDVTGTNVVTMQAMVAKNPAAMTTGATSVYTYQRSGGTLTLTQTRTPSGPSAVPVTITLVRVE